MEIKKFLTENFVAWKPTGSRYICDPPVIGTDEDYICLSSGNENDLLFSSGFECNTNFDEGYDEMSDFTTWRLNDFNLIVTDDFSFYKKFVEATEEAKRMNILSKHERIKLFQKILYNNDIDEQP